MHVMMFSADDISVTKTVAGGGVFHAVVVRPGLAGACGRACRRRAAGPGGGGRPGLAAGRAAGPGGACGWAWRGVRPGLAAYAAGRRSAWLGGLFGRPGAGPI